MAGSTQQTAPLAAAINSSATDDGLDNISLTSTVDEDYAPDTEFIVEGIRSERIWNGVHQYLVKWSNFPLDQCTYEPEESLPDTLKAEWEEKKLQEGPGAADEFVKKFDAASSQKWEESRQRHRRRNAKRRRLGLATTRFHFRGTYYLDSEDEADDATKSQDSESDDMHDNQDGLNAWNDSSESDQAQEDDQMDHKAAEALLSSKSRTKRTKPQPRPNRIFWFKPGQAAPKKPQMADPAVKDSIHVRQKVPTPGPQPSKQPSRPRELPSSTGYQGSARKSSSITVREKPIPTIITSLPTRPPAGPAKGVATQYTARKTTQKPLDKPNIFTGGAKRKKRELADDAPQKGRLYSHVSHRRKSELKSRRKEDEAPDIQKLPYVFTPGALTANAQPSEPSKEAAPDRLASSSDGARPVVQDTGARTTTALPTQSTQLLRTPSVLKSALATPKRGAPAPESEPAAKRPKSVRFTEAYDEETADGEPRSKRYEGADERFPSEAMDIDEVTESPGDTISVAMAEDAPMAAAPDKSLWTRQNICKPITLVSSPNKTLQVVFNGVPKGPPGDDDPQWLEAFLNIGCLSFGHTVLAETLLSQFHIMGPQATQHLCSGIITSEVVEDQNALDTIAEHLRVGHLGLFVAHKDFNVLIYPTKCDGFELEAFGADPTSADGVALKHFVFASTCPISQLLMSPTGQLESAQKPFQIEVGQEMVLFFTKIFAVRLSRLGYPHAKPKQFFFAFPERAMEWQRSFCNWLSRRDARCKIYTNATPGSWSAFVEKATQEPGVIIMHEAVVPIVRRFPGIWKLLQLDSCVWRFSESPRPPHLPSLQNPPDQLPAPMLSGLFTHGIAILITPSFLLSQPREALKLFKWFFTGQTHVSYNKLVTAYNLRDYLHGLAKEKTEQSTFFKAARWRRMAELEARTEMNASGLTDDDVAASQRNWLEVARWLDQQLEPDVPFSENNHVIYADAFIDPNDEQSLVNWFGWWTLVRSDTYRKLYVIGSNSSHKHHAHGTSQPLPRMARKMKIPSYSPSVVNDPDACLRISPKPSRDVLEPSAEKSVPERDRTAWFQSERYFPNGEGDIANFLARQDRGGFIRVFRFLVSYLDTAMADHFGDFRMNCRTYKQWWDILLPWLGDESKKFNTYFAFFHTIQEDWVPDNFLKNLKPRRYPWVVAYRPVEPHRKYTEYKHGRNELIIWDVQAGDVLEEKSQIELADLTWMQQELVRYVQSHADEKMPGSFLENVWLGGFQDQQSKCASKLPMDMTAEFFEVAISNVMDVIPSTRNYMSKRGYRPVVFRQESQTQTHTAAMDPSAAGDADKPSEDDKRTIFHPPRGSATPHSTGSSVCTNDLFEAARMARVRDRNAREMTFRYRPTLEWYQQQVDEGRQFEHIHVGEWDDVSKALNINSCNPPGKPPASAASATSGTASEQSLGLSRRSSSNSIRSSPKT